MEGEGVFFQGRRAAVGLIVFIFTAIFPQLPGFAASVTVQWDPSPDPNVVGYNFYYGVASRTYTNIIDVGNSTTATVSNLVEGVTYYFAATAYNLLGTESVFSDELSYTVPTAANNPPTLNAINNVTLNEDAAAQTVSLTGIGTGAANETQTLAVTATSSNPSLIPNPAVTYTSPNATGSLAFTPVANANGTATITVTVNDGQAQNNTVTRTFTVTVNVVNDAPTLNTLVNLTLNEDVGTQTVNLAGIGTGAANETQTLAVTATSSNPSLIPNPTVTYTSPNGTGSLAFTPAANANGTATITVTVNDGQAQNNTAIRTFTVTVNAVNDAPTLNALSNLSLSENAGLQTVALAGIGTGAANETQTLAVTATSSNPSLIPNPTVTYTTPNTTGSLAFTPVAGLSGTATISVTVNDGQAQNNLFTRTFVVGVNAVNDSPTLNALSNVTLNEDAATQTVNLAGISSGSTSEVQTLTVTATSSNPGLIPSPTVTYTSPNPTGTLSLTPAANSNGTATITVTVNDGQPLNNTVSRSFTVTVNAVNDSPTLNTLGNLTINEDAGVQTVSLTGVGTGAANESQTLAVTATSSDPSLIPNPTVSYTSPNGTGSLAFTPAANANGTATITVTVNDGQAQNNLFTRTFTVTVNAVNDLPTLNTLANLGVIENSGLQTVSLIGISSGAANETQTLAVTAVSSNPGLIPNPTVNYTSPNATGSLSFTPVANANGTATITVTVNDGQPQNNTVTRTFTITVAEFVNTTPTLNAINNLTLNEDAGAQTVNLAGITSGSASESQTLTVTATSSNPGLIPNPTVNYTNPNTFGTLSFAPVANSNGTATITVTVNDGETQNNTFSRTFTVTVNAVNDAPTLDALSNLTLNEDSAAQTVNLAGIGTGMANETQALTVTATSSNPGLIPNPTVSYTSPNSTGTLNFTPVANGNGTATITVTVNDGQPQNNTATRTFTVTVNSVNDAPTFNALSNLSLNENVGLQMVALAGIGSGAANESQTLTVTATSSNPGLIPNPTVNYTSPNSTGTLTFTPVANANGTATITVTVNDGQAQNNTFSRTFTIAVNDINDPPTLNALSNLSLNEDAGDQTVNLSGISSGAANESQTLTLTATSSNPGLIPNPTVGYTSPNSTGTLTLTPAANASGSAIITVRVDDGQTLNNTVTRTFTVTVNAVNDSPTLNTLGNLTLSEDAGVQTVNLAGISPGAANETQTLTITATSSNPGLIPNPTVSYTSPNTAGSLSFTPAADLNGTATITVTVNDGQPQNNTLTRTFTVTVNAVNDPPTINGIGNRILSEDATIQTVNLSGIGSGATNENQTLTITASSSNTGLIPDPTVSYTSPNSTGTLNFTPVANANGGATITVVINDGLTTFSRSFTVTVNAANDSPTLATLNNLTLNEDAPAQSVSLSGIGTGAANESQTLIVTATSSNPGLIPNPTVSYISPDTTGSLAFAPAADSSGTATITVTVDDGQSQNNTFSRSFTVTVNNVNDLPTLNALTNLSLDENAGLQTVNLTGISSGATNESQVLTITATSSNPGLIPNPSVTYTSPNATGSLIFTPAAGGSGTATITVTVNDGQAQNNLFTRTFVVGVNAVNDPPTLNAIGNLSLNEDAAAQTVNLSGISSGSASEAQTLTVNAISSNPALIPNPTVNYTSPNTAGSLSFTPVANANGTATITVTVDDGQAANNSVSRTFSITVNPANDPPALSPLGNLTLNEDAAAQTVNLSGIGSGAANESQTLTVTASSSNPGLIPNPTVSYTSPGTSGTLNFTPVADANGAATITVTVNDGQAQNNTAVRTFTVTVTAMNDSPTLDAPGDLTLDENAGLQTVNLAGISSGAANEIQTLTVTATSSNPGLIPNPTVNYTSANSTGSLSFTPVANANGSATITVTVNDGQSQNNNVTRTFTVLVNSINQSPTISAITNVLLAANTASPEIPFTIGDVETDTSNLILQATSSNPTLVAPSGITFGGTGANRTLTITPLLNRDGDSDITITVSDGSATASTTFLLTVLGVPPPPSSLTVITNGDGSITGAPTTQNVKEGQIYTLTAVAGEGQMFTGWSGSTNSLSPTLVIKARTNLLLRANFVPLNLTLNGTGTVTPNLKKTRNLSLGKSYTIRAAGGPGQMFVGWSGSTNTTSPSLTFVMSSNLNLQANFVPVKLTVSGTGTLSPDLRKTLNPIPGQTYTIRAMPGVGQEFAGWTGSIESSLSSLSVVLTTNLTLQANFIPSPYIPIAGTYQGLFYEETEVRRHTSGYFNVAVTTRGTYSGWVQTALTRHTFTGKLGLDCRATNRIIRPYYSPLHLTLNFGSGSEIDMVSGQVGDTNWTATVFGDRVVFNLRTNPAPYAGNYTLVLPGQVGSPSLPAGDGFGTLKVTASGLTTFTGTMGDGARVMQSSAVSKHGYWPLHSVLTYGTAKGAVIGWMNFADRTDDDLNGTLIWTRPPNLLERFYQLGFNTECQAVGSAYRTPVGPQTNYVLNLTQAKAAFSGGNLPVDFSNSILFGPNSRVSNLSGNPLTLTFATSLGTYSGTVTDPTTLKSFAFKGAVLQKQNAGFGFLTGTNRTSRVIIQAP